MKQNVIVLKVFATKGIKQDSLDKVLYILHRHKMLEIDVILLYNFDIKIT